MNSLPKYSQIFAKLFSNIGDGLGLAYAFFITSIQYIANIPMPEGSLWANNILILSIAGYFAARAYHYVKKGRQK